MNFQTFITDAPGLCTFRVLGFGVIVYRLQTLLGDDIDEKVWGVPILPYWRLAFVAPWI